MYIGIDVGGTNLKAGLVNEEGTIVAVERTPLDFQGPEPFAETLAQLAAAVMERGGVEVKDVAYVGMGIPGAVKGGEILYTANIPMKNVPLEALFRKHLDLPVLLGNDADCAAVGEWSCGGSPASSSAPRRRSSGTTSSCGASASSTCGSSSACGPSRPSPSWN